MIPLEPRSAEAFEKALRDQLAAGGHELLDIEWHRPEPDPVYMEAMPGVRTWIRRDRLEELQLLWGSLFEWLLWTAIALEDGHPTSWTFPC